MPIKTMQSDIQVLPYRVILWYLSIGACWILFSDTMLGLAVHDHQRLTELEILKGWFFLLVTSVLLLLLLRRGLGIIAAKTDHVAASEAHYRQLFERMQNGFAVNEVIYSPTGVPVDFRVLEFNPAFERITGLKAEAVIGKPARETLPALEPAWIDSFLRVAATGEPAQFSGYLKELGRYFEICAYPAAPGRFAVLCTDVTEQRLVEKELMKLHEALEDRVNARTAQYIRANETLKLEIEQRARAEEEISWLNADLMRQKADLEAANRELEAFSFSVSHDLRAPLRHIAGFSQALKDDHAGALPPEGEEYLNRIVRSCDTMSVLIDDLLELSRIARSDMNRKQLDLSRIAASVAEELKQADPQRRVTFRIEPGVEALGDERLVGIALQNLMGNAYKYTGKKDEALIEFGTEIKEGRRVYYVKDNGAGFDMRYADKLFGPFQRLHRKEEFEGTGVGLAIVQRIVHRHGGRIDGTGVPGEGATFCFTLS